jgi:hypothetical protein
MNSSTPTLNNIIEVQEEPGLIVAASTNLTMTTESQNEFQSTMNTTAFTPLPTLDYIYNSSEEADMSVINTLEVGKLPVVAETAIESQQNEMQSNINSTSYAPLPTLDYNPYNNVGDNFT